MRTFCLTTLILSLSTSTSITVPTTFASEQLWLSYFANFGTALQKKSTAPTCSTSLACHGCMCGYAGGCSCAKSFWTTILENGVKSFRSSKKIIFRAVYTTSPSAISPESEGRLRQENFSQRWHRWACVHLQSSTPLSILRTAHLTLTMPLLLN